MPVLLHNVCKYVKISILIFITEYVSSVYLALPCYVSEFEFVVAERPICFQLLIFLTLNEVDVACETSDLATDASDSVKSRQPR